MTLFASRRGIEGSAVVGGRTMAAPQRCCWRYSCSIDVLPSAFIKELDTDVKGFWQYLQQQWHLNTTKPTLQFLVQGD
ncbi:hypothetical protein O9992_26395 [Vibrio lentus]|nr:hypothetical protein [Vibrio lentus]